MTDNSAIADEPIAEWELRSLFGPLDYKRVALAVSGGVDSMVLLHLFAIWRQIAAGQKWEAAVNDSLAFSDLERAPIIGLPRYPPALSANADWLGSQHDKASLKRSLTRSPAIVLTVDHGLRAESAQEASFVSAEAKLLGLPCQTLRWTADGPSLWQKAKASLSPQDGLLAGLQEKARTARYELMADAIESELWALWQGGELASNPLDAPGLRRTIITAHNRDDLIETFLMRLKRGSGIDGLSSIRTSEVIPRAPTPERRYPAAIEIMRPLLSIPRSRILATAEKLGIKWLEDPSNTDEQFERVRTRKQVKALAEMGFKASELHSSIRRLQRARESVHQYQSRQVHDWSDKDRTLDWHNGLYVTFRPNNISVRGVEFSALYDVYAEARLRLLKYAIRCQGGGAVEPSLAQLEELSRHLYRTVGRVARRAAEVGQRSSDELNSLMAGSTRTLAGCRFDVYLAPADPSYEAYVRIWREAGRRPLPEFLLQPGDGGWWDNRFAISLLPSAPQPMTVKALGPECWAMIKKRVPALSLWRGIPSGAAATLPAIWAGDRLVAVPFFEQLNDVVLPRWLRREIDHEWDATNGLGGTMCKVRYSPPID